MCVYCIKYTNKTNKQEDYLTKEQSSGKKNKAPLHPLYNFGDVT